MTGYGGMEKRWTCDEMKFTFKFKYNYNVTEMLDKNEINCFMSNDEI